MRRRLCLTSKRLLSAENQPYSISHSQSQSLSLYREVSTSNNFAAEEANHSSDKQQVGLPGRVFMRKMPKWTPDVRFFKSEEYPRVVYARRYNVIASLALPIFQETSGNCVAVMEMVTTHHSIEYASQLHNIYHACP
ncbi:unnamed protein product [Cochlearia groenlandica]